MATITRTPADYDAQRYDYDTRAMFACENGTRYVDKGEVMHADCAILRAALRAYSAEGHAVSEIALDPARGLYVADVYDLGVIA